MLAINITFTLFTLFLIWLMYLLKKESIEYESISGKIVFYVIMLPTIIYLIYLSIDNWVLYWKIIS